MLRNALFAVAIACSLLIPAAVLAQDESPADGPISGFEAGLQTGFGVPFGAIEKDSGSDDVVVDAQLSDLVTGKVPVIVDAGYRINDHVYAGAYFQYALAMLSDDACPSGADCAASVLRYGLEGQYHVRPRERFDPWVGLGLGLETVGTTVSLGGADAEGSIDGIEFLHLTGGFDYRVHEKVAIGPVVTFTLSQYTDAEVEAAGRTFGGSIANQALHEWLIVGVRARFHP